jgi:hypothetical protein
MATRINYFLAYMRQGITTLADHGQVAGRRMTIPVKLTVTASDKIINTDRQDVVEKVISVFGPGDVLGINENVISRLAPVPNIYNFQPTLTPFIEFSEPDFLWRFTSLQTTDKKNWIPWLSLIILKSENGEEEAEYVKVENSNKALPPQIELKGNAILPDLKESWRWAHVHKLDFAGADATQVANIIKTTPEKTVCRLLSPRKLKPQTKYHAFLVPAFKIGAEAAMGLAGGTEDRTMLTWETPGVGAGKTLPYYYDWEFGTDTKGDFEYLVRKLKPFDLENMGTRPIDCSNPGYGMEEEKLELQMEAALKSLDTNVQSWGMDSVDGSDVLSKKKQEELANLLNKREENINGNIKLRVTPPVYGEWYASREGESVKVDVQNRNHWLEELNLDFRHRAAAGLGVQFVKENQENLMKAAWEQLSKIKKVNQELNLGRFGREISACMYQRLSKMKPNNLFQIALPVQNKIVFQPAQTIGALLRDSTITNNLTKTKFKKYSFKMKSAEVRSDFKPVDTSQLVTLSYKVERVKGVRDANPATDVRSRSIRFAATTTTWPEGLVDKTVAALDPKTTIEARIKSRISRFRKIEATKVVENTQQEDALHPVKWYPEFHRPMYHFLRELSQEYILPGLENVPQNTVGLLQTNRRFIEAFMVGLNHEMASELRWREFPTDLRGSYFRSFWDTSIYSVDETEKIQFRSTDTGLKLLDEVRAKYGDAFNTFPVIEALYVKADPNETEKEIADAYENAIEQWLLTRDEDKDVGKLAQWKKDNRLGDNPVAGKWNNQEEDQNQIVLLIRGELLQKFSNTLIYLVKKKADGKPDLDQGAARTFPVFEGALPPDIVFIGFPIKEAEAADYFVIFEERMTELRFGLDETPEGSAPGPGENDFSWQHFPTLAQEGYLDGIEPTIFTQQWNNAAFISKVMVQKQVRAAVRLAELLPG